MDRQIRARGWATFKVSRDIRPDKIDADNSMPFISRQLTANFAFDRNFGKLVSSIDGRA